VRFHRVSAEPEETAMTRLSDPPPVVKSAADIDSYLWAGATRLSVVRDAEDTSGQFTLLDQFGASGDATPLHRHLHDDEAFYLLEGEIVALAGDREHRVGAGSALFLPRGLPHAFMVTSASARLITVAVPAGFDAFVRAAGIPHRGPAPSSWEFDLGRLMQPAQAAGIEILGPPPFGARPDLQPPVSEG
jgi:quercetin dioxygenase-like cupin family protein